MAGASDRPTVHSWFNPGSTFAIGGDLRTFHTAAYLVTHGRADLVYQSPAFEMVFVVEGGGYGPFSNTPALLPLIAPLGWLSFEAAWFVLAIVSILGIVLGLHLLGIRRLWLGTALAMLFPPVYFALTFGQVSVLWFVILAATYRLLRLRRPHCRRACRWSAGHEAAACHWPRVVVAG